MTPEMSDESSENVKMVNKSTGVSLTNFIPSNMSSAVLTPNGVSKQVNITLPSIFKDVATSGLIVKQPILKSKREKDMLRTTLHSICE